MMYSDLFCIRNPLFSQDQEFLCKESIKKSRSYFEISGVQKCQHYYTIYLENKNFKNLLSKWLLFHNGINLMIFTEYEECVDYPKKAGLIFFYEKMEMN